MNEFWNLDPIYGGFEDPAYEQDLQQLRELAGKYNDFAAALSQLDSLEGLTRGITWQEQLTDVAMKLLDYAQLRQTTNTRDSQAGSYMGQIMQILSTTAGKDTLKSATNLHSSSLLTKVKNRIPGNNEEQ